MASMRASQLCILMARACRELTRECKIEYTTVVVQNDVGAAAAAVPATGFNWP